MTIEPDEDGTPRQIDDLATAIGFCNAMRIVLVIYALIALGLYFVL